MSIASLFVQPDAAYIVSDSGFFDEAGKVLLLWPKAFLAPRSRYVYAAVGGSGAVLAAVAHEMGANLGTTDYHPEAFKDLIRRHFENLGADPKQHYLRFVAAGWDAGLDRPIGLSFFTDPDDALEGWEPWTWYRMKSLLQPHMSMDDRRAVGIADDLCNPDVFDPALNAMRYVEAVRQRRTGWGADGSLGGCYVAGKITLAKVTRSGVEFGLLHEYPDCVGELAGVEG